MASTSETAGYGHDGVIQVVRPVSWEVFGRHALVVVFAKTRGTESLEYVEE